MKKVLKWAASNGLFAILLYYAVFVDIVGAQRLMIFLVWTNFFICLTMFTDAGKKILKEHGRSVPVSVTLFFDFACVFLLIWFGYWITSIVHFLHICVQQSAWAEIEKESSSAKSPA